MRDQPNTCDLLGLLEKLEPIKSDTSIGYRPLVELFEQKGRHNLRKYIEKHLTKEEATFLYNYYSKNDADFREILNDLPSDLSIAAMETANMTANAVLPGFLKWLNPVNGKAEEETRKQVEKAMKKAKQNIRAKMLKELETIKMPKAKTFKSAIDLLHKVGGTSKANGSSPSFEPEQFKNLVFYVEPFIFGNTPLCEALKSALELFSKCDQDTTKMLFILTDGEATDGNPAQYADRFKSQNINVFVSLITPKNVPNPRRLYEQPDANWNSYAKNMFELSSSVPNTHTAMSVLLERGWKLSPEGQSRLFVQSNHPQVLDEFCSLVRDMAQSNDALLSIFGRVSLDKYINTKMTNFCAPNQVGGTCYANAVAAVLHLAMSRIVGRQVPDFEALRSDIIRAFGTDGAVTAHVLREWSKKCRLQCKKVDEMGAKQAINARRPVIATFRLTDEQWNVFSEFYRKNPQGILEKKDLQTSSRSGETFGHAVVLMKCDPQGLTFMNSWGNKWGDDGFFKVRDQSVLNAMTFYDVYWTMDDLDRTEKEAYELKKKSVARDVAQDLPQHLKHLPYKCPLCSKSSPAIDFVGHLMEAKCPKCERNFKPTPLGFVLNW